MSMMDISERGWSFAKSADRVWVFIGVVLAAVALLDATQLVPSVQFALNAVLSTAPYMLLAIFAIGFLKATGAETLVATAFQGNEVRMIVVASLVGGLSPFCSCEIIPFIAALLAVGTPLSAVMALWLASPLMDPAIFLITSGELGWSFAIAKTVAAVGLGLAGGLMIHWAVKAGYFSDVLLNQPVKSCCGTAKSGPYEGKPVAYLNGYAAPAIVSGLMEQGMVAGAALTFMIAGGVTSIPAMTAVFALVKKPIFAAYIGLGISGAIVSGLLYNAYLMLV